MATTTKAPAKKAAAKKATAKKATAKRATAKKAPARAAKSKTASSGQKLVEQAMVSAFSDMRTAMMLADSGLTLRYVNPAAQQLLEEKSEDFEAVSSDFDASSVCGGPIDFFHGDAAFISDLVARQEALPHVEDVEVGESVFHLRINLNSDPDGSTHGYLIEWEDVTEVRGHRDAARRLAHAVKTTSTAMMMVGRDRDITYVNDRAIELMRSHEQALRQLDSAFCANDLVGQSMGAIYAVLEQQSRSPDDPKQLPFHTRIEVGSLRFELHVGAIFDDDGDFAGNSLEWKDVTQQSHAEEQVQDIIQACTEGRLSDRLDVSRYEGFMARNAEGINGLLDTLVEPLEDALGVLESLAAGDLNHRLETEGLNGFKLALRQRVNRILEGVVEPIEETRNVLGSLSEGDLSRSVEGDYSGSFADLASGANASVEKLRDIVFNIHSGAGRISEAAQQVNEGNSDLSNRTQENASALEETASAIEEITTTIKQNADNAGTANQLAASARELASKGGDVVSHAIGAMGEINKSSKQIADIIGVIDEIAFQTNLLALNAAVEAARAGEQGRGFAVVASEVRNLAQRSATAAKEIKTLIKSSVERVEDGSKLVDQSGETLDEIVVAVKKVSDVVAEIAAASEEQAAAIEQVNKAVADMDESTQQNAALVEEAAAASESMDAQARELQSLVSFFRSGDEDAPAVESPRPHRRGPSASTAHKRSAPASKTASRCEPTARSKGKSSLGAVSGGFETDADGIWESF